MLQWNWFPVSPDDLVVLPGLAMPQSSWNIHVALQVLAFVPAAHGFSQECFLLELSQVFIQAGLRHGQNLPVGQQPGLISRRGHSWVCGRWFLGWGWVWLVSEAITRLCKGLCYYARAMLFSIQIKIGKSIRSPFSFQLQQNAEEGKHFKAEIWPRNCFIHHVYWNRQDN